MRPSTLRWRVYVLVGSVVSLLVVTVAATSLARLHVTDLNGQLRATLRPAQASAATLAKAYVDMETGVRGFLLSGQRQLLEPYDAGRADAFASRERLRALLAGDPAAERLLDSVDTAAAAWEDTLATPAVRGEIAGTGKQLFDALRRPLAALQSHIDRRTAATVQAASDASASANLVTILCASLALALGAVIVMLLQRSLVRPVSRLVANVRRVSGGDLSHQVLAAGPAEVIALGTAVESMRERILLESARAARTSEQLVRLQEADRIAEDLGATTIRDLFSISLALQSAAARYPSAAATLTGVTSDVDRVLQEIRSRVFSRTIRDVLVTLTPDLAAAPRVSGAADVAAPAELESVLRDVLPAFPGPATVHVDADEAHPRVRITGTPPTDLSGLTELAAHHEATVTRTPIQVTVDWPPRESTVQHPRVHLS
jgi:CHASE3 domain sensor protein